MPPEEADSTEGTAKPRQLAEPEECPGGAKIKPPFEMGVSDLSASILWFKSINYDFFLFSIFICYSQNLS